MLRLAHDDGGGNGVAEWVEVAGCDDCGECGTQAVLEVAGPLHPGHYLVLLEVCVTVWNGMGGWNEMECILYYLR